MSDIQIYSHEMVNWLFSGVMVSDFVYRLALEIVICLSLQWTQMLLSFTAVQETNSSVSLLQQYISWSAVANSLLKL